MLGLIVVVPVVVEEVGGLVVEEVGGLVVEEVGGLVVEEVGGLVVEEVGGLVVVDEVVVLEHPITDAIKTRLIIIERKTTYLLFTEYSPFLLFDTRNYYNRIVFQMQQPLLLLIRQQRRAASPALSWHKHSGTPFCQSVQ